METVFPFPSGSLWRKWDLHIHTPLSIDNNYGGTSDEVWEKFITDLEGMDQDIKVIGINDYWFLDGYKKVVEFKRAGRLPNIEAIFPVVEFRIKNFSGTDGDLQKINFHVIFSDELDPALIEAQFLNGMTSKFSLSPEYAATSWSTGVITRDSLTALGKQIQASVPSERQGDFSDHLKEGFNGLSVDFKDAIDFLKERPNFFGGKYLTAIGKTEWANIKWNDQSVPDKKHLINSVDFVFISAESGEACNATREKLQSECVNHRLLDCSDAHNYSTADVKDRIGKCFTWIKCDPTFKGLREVRIEPLGRVAFGDVNPMQKKPYQYIRSVRFNDNAVAGRFSPEPIAVNPDLVSIIGGKSTGKSLLLYYIAQSVDPEEVKKRGVSPHYFDSEANFNFEVEWGDGRKSVLVSMPGADSIDGRKILYIPQNYLHAQSGDDPSSGSSINEMVTQVLTQDSETLEKHEQHRTTVQMLQKKITGEIENVFSITADIFSVDTELKELGDSQGVKSYIADVEKQINDLSRAAGLNEDEMTALASFSTTKADHERSLSTADEDIRVATQSHEELSERVTALANGFRDLAETMTSPSLKKVFEGEAQKLEAFAIASASAINVGIANAKMARRKVLEEIAKLEAQIKPYHDRVKMRDKIEALKKIAAQETKRLGAIEAKVKRLSDLKKDLASSKTSLLTAYGATITAYETLRTHLKLKEARLGGINFNLTIAFDEAGFQKNTIDAYINKKTLKDITGFSHGSEYYYRYAIARHQETITKIADGILSGDIALLKGVSKRDALQKLLGNYYRLDYKISYKGDALENMSPGKKSLVLLRILMDVSDEQWPILLDQPEDDLDNRSIYNDLVKVLQERKHDRQIIIATHNPNVVVGADSEEIIVCNQTGQEQDRNNRNYTFEYVSGSIENSFVRDGEFCVLYQKGIREHICEVLEGGLEAFEKREQRYGR
ncbi:hypothetical protein EPN81_03820 [Patescibacteria group bacterium]|nr:MAG: hypothetical protein EPN81_03820 [Patescibacteria group bacterium]